MKVKYQYTYFINSFTIEKKQYQKYILNLMNNKNIKPKIYNKQKDTDLEQYFLQDAKEIMFKTMEMSETEQRKLENKYKKLAKLPAVVFEYLVDNNTQSKMGQEDGFFFKIDKIELICFKNGIGFMLVKTYVEENTDMKNILDFNYKFKTAKEPIYIQTNEFKEKINLSELLYELTGQPELKDVYTYSYLCVDGEDWNEQKDFSLLEKEFIKLVNTSLAQSEEAANEKTDREIDIIENSNYVKIGIGKEGSALITNSLDTYNCTKLPYEFENKYLYTLIFALYQKALVKNIMKQNSTFSKMKRRLEKFTNKEFIKEITSEEMGKALYKKWQE